MLLAMNRNSQNQIHSLLFELDEIDCVATAPTKQIRRSEILEEILAVVAVALKGPSDPAARLDEGRWL